MKSYSIAFTGLNIIPVLILNSVASSFLNSNGRPKRRKRKYILFTLRGTSGEMDLSSLFLKEVEATSYSQSFTLRYIFLTYVVIEIKFLSAAMFVFSMAETVFFIISEKFWCIISCCYQQEVLFITELV